MTFHSVSRFNNSPLAVSSHSPPVATASGGPVRQGDIPTGLAARAVPQSAALWAGAPRQGSGLNLIAHRGGDQAPENTLSAFRSAAEHGYKVFECDVKLSGNTLYVLHDDSLVRTTGLDKPASELAWSELSNLSAGHGWGEAFREERLPTLPQVIHLAKELGMVPNFEIKPDPQTDVQTGHAVARALMAYYPAGEVQPMVSSFSKPALEAAIKAAPHLPHNMLYAELKPGWVQEAKDLGCWGVVTEQAQIQLEHVTAAHEAGLAFGAYTVNDPKEAQRLNQAGVDLIFTDKIKVFQPGQPLPLPADHSSAHAASAA